MKIIVFYSFKGGVGRTTCLLSAAYMLALRGRRVVVADWDLQAPGLSLMECMWPAGGGLPEAGILEYLNGLRAENREKRITVPSLLRHPRLIEQAQERKTGSGDRAMKGDLWFVPAGNLGGGVDAFIRAVNDGKLHDLRRFLSDINGDPRMVFKVFCEEVLTARIRWNAETPGGEPHYLLVDCRTGITEIGDLLLGDAADFNVIVYGQDPQNLEGLRVVLSASPRRPGDLVASTMLIWSGDVEGQEDLKSDQRRRKRDLVQQVARRDSLGLPEPFPREFLLPFNPELVYSNVPLVHRVPDSGFAARFSEMTDYLEERCLWEDNLIERAKTSVEPAAQESPEQRRLRAATTPKEWDSQLVREALTKVELGRSVKSLLFNPPSWNLAAMPTPELTAGWPKGLSSDDGTLVVQLLAYSIAVPAAEKRSILERRGTLSAVQLRRLLEALTNERHGCFALTADAYWGLVSLIMAAGMDWLALLAEPSPPGGLDSKRGGGHEPLGLSVREEVSVRADEVLRALMHGQVVDQLAVSAHPLGRLLVAESIRRASAGSETLLSKWLRSVSLDANALRVQLTEIACNGADERGLLDNVRAFCWERYADSLDDSARAAPGAERTQLFDRAIGAYRQSLSLRPDHAATLTNLGAALAGRGQAAREDERVQWFDRAIDACQRSLSLRPDDADTLANLGAALADRGQAAREDERVQWFDRAIDACQRSLSLRPDDAATLMNLGGALFRRGQAAPEDGRVQWFDRAIDACQRSLSLRPDDAATLSNLGTALADRGQAAPEDERVQWFDRAIDAYQRSLSLRPDDADTLTNLGTTLAGRGRAVPENERVQWFDRAIDAYQRSLSRRPDDAATLRNLGAALADRGQGAPEGERVQWFDRAIDACQRSLSFRPDDADTLGNLTIALMQKLRIVGDDGEKSSLLTKAAASIEGAMRLAPDEARYNYACFLALKGDKGQALAELRTLLARKPERRRDVAKDEDFASLADSPDFQALIAGGGSRERSAAAEGQKT